MTESIQALSLQLPAELAQHRTLFLILGALVAAVGVAAVVKARAATLFTMVFTGWMMIIGSCAVGLAAFLVGNWSGFFLLLLSAVFFGVLGCTFAFRPAITAEAVTMILAAYFVATGLVQILVPLVLRMDSWAWMALNGGVSVFLGILVFRALPAAGLWAIGLFVGIDLIFDGLGLIGLAIELKG